jgi:glycosyltransferase involved in cell wall biosynthesis
MVRSPVILLTTEGTYPYALGGVSTWCHTLTTELHDVEFYVLAVAMNPYVVQRFAPPPNVRRVIPVPLWGMHDPSAHHGDVPFSDVFLQKRRTTADSVERVLWPLLNRFLQALMAEDGGALGEASAALHRAFRLYDYLETMKSPVVWSGFREWLQEGTRRGFWPEPTVFEAVQGLGWIYHFLIVVNTPLPDVDVVHSSAAAFCGLPGIVAKIQQGARYILTEHGVYLREQYLAVGRSNMSSFGKHFLMMLVRAVVKANLYWADEIAPVCRFNERWERLLGADARRIHVIYNGVSPEIFHPKMVSEGNPTSDQDDAARDRFEVLVVARSDPNKDLETLIRAVHLAHQKLPGLHCSILGAVSVPDYHRRMVDLVRELGLSDVIDFQGHTSEIAEAYRRCDVVVQSSVSEAFPYSVIEAMMSGRPVIATDVGGTSEALGDTGILIPSRDPARLALALIMVARDRALRDRLGRLAHERARRLFDIRLTIAQFRRLYRRLYGIPEVGRSGGGRKVLLLARGWALAKAGLSDLALEQFRQALLEDFGAAARAPILAEMGRLEWALGQADRGARHLVAAWILARRVNRGSEPA